MSKFLRRKAILSAVIVLPLAVGPLMVGGGAVAAFAQSRQLAAPPSRIATPKVQLPEGIGEPAPAPQAAAGGGGAQLGAPAPEFTLGKFGGGEVALAQHKDKDIVVLDFFASWCGPCRMSMPVVHETLKAYADKGVQLYGVNLREPDEKVTQFLTSSKIEGMPVLLDRNGAVAMQYGASSIPRLIIVGKDGTVQAIHSGYSPALVEELKTQLDQLLGGKPLVTPASS